MGMCNIEALFELKLPGYTSLFDKTQNLIKSVVLPLFSCHKKLSEPLCLRVKHKAVLMSEVSYSNHGGRMTCCLSLSLLPFSLLFSFLFCLFVCFVSFGEKGLLCISGFPVFQFTTLLFHPRGRIRTLHLVSHKDYSYNLCPSGLLTSSRSCSNVKDQVSIPLLKTLLCAFRSPHPLSFLL